MREGVGMEAMELRGWVGIGSLRHGEALEVEDKSGRGRNQQILSGFFFFGEISKILCRDRGRGRATNHR